MRVIVIVLITSLGILSWHRVDAAGDSRAGEVIYDHYCKSCHETGLKGAPKVGDRAAWAQRIKKGELRLTNHVYFGHRKMPMFGDCSACNIQDIANAVAYMVRNSE